ncbi:MAG: hypothetical protein Phog2KO_50960 [Phototrophicaceae bacterium]
MTVVQPGGFVFKWKPLRLEERANFVLSTQDKQLKDKWKQRPGGSELEA